jgi:hypothetical protein
MAYVLLTSNKKLMQDSETLSLLSAYIIRASFWIVLLVGIVDMILSFLRVEGFLVPLFGKDIGMALGRPSFRGTYVHFPKRGTKKPSTLRKDKIISTMPTNSTIQNDARII